MNQIHPSMKFTFEYSHEQITYLDTDVHINQNLPCKLYVTTHIKSTNKQAYTLDTDVHINQNLPCKLYVTTHIKSTNKQAYTHASSHYPPGTGKGIAIGEAIRYARTNTFQSDFNKSIKQHTRQMIVRGYTSDYIISSIEFVQHQSKYKKQTRKTNNRPVFVTRFTTSAAKVTKIIRHHWHYIQHCREILSPTSNNGI